MRSGDIVVADSGNHRVQVFSPAGVFRFAFGSFGAAEGQFVSPVGVATDRRDNIIVVDAGNHRIQVFDRTGRFRHAFGSFGTAEGEFVTPFGVATDRRGNIVVTDRGNGRVQVFDQTGAFSFTFGTFGGAPAEVECCSLVAVARNPLSADSVMRYSPGLRTVRALLPEGPADHPPGADLPERFTLSPHSSGMVAGSRERRHMFLFILVIVAVACMGRRFSGRRRFGAWGDHDWRRPPGRPQGDEPSESMRERFEAWHRAKHAHQHRDGDPADTEYA